MPRAINHCDSIAESFEDAAQSMLANYAHATINTERLLSVAVARSHAHTFTARTITQCIIDLHPTSGVQALQHTISGPSVAT